MAVYTKLTQEEIALHLTKYEIGELLSFQEILAGIDNSNFILTTSKGKFILTIFESRIDKKALPFFINLKLHLAQKGISCPRPILDKQGAVIATLKEKESVIVTFLNGKPAEKITKQHCFEVGKFLAQLHVAAADFEMYRQNDLGITGWKPLLSRFEHLLENYQKGLRQEILNELEFLQKSWHLDLPSAAVHLDFFPDNVFFDELSQASGAIDFYFAADDALVFDFAITVNAWCFDDQRHFNEEKFGEMLRGYEEVRKFSVVEKEFLKIALVGSAMRFLLTRLHDMFFTPKDSFVTIKDPQEYLAKLRFFKSKI